MPAVYCWAPPAGSDLLATTAANWVGGPGVPYATHTLPPDGDDDLYFQGDVTQAGCLIPDLPAPANPYGLTFKSIRLLFGAPLTPLPLPDGGTPPPASPPVGYWGTVTIRDSFAVGTLRVECGAIAQADAETLGLSTPNAGTLTVKTALDWTGGTLNNTSVAGFIDLAPGSISVAAPSFTNPGINGTVYIGSTLRLLGNELPDLPSLASSLEMVGGIYHIARGFLEVGIASILTLAPVPKSAPGEMVEVKLDKEVPVSPDQQGYLLNREKGTVIVRPKNRTTSTATLPAPVTFEGGATFDNAGTVELKDRAQLIFDPSGNGLNLGYYQRYNFKAVTKVEAGCSFIAKGSTYVNIDNGHFQLVERRTQAGEIDTTQPAVVIVAEKPENDPARTALRVSKHAGIQRVDPTDTVPVRLSITGHFECDGKIDVFVDRTTGFKNDRIELKMGKVTFGDEAKVYVRWLASTEPSAPPNSEWKLIEIDSTAAADKINKKPAFEHLDPGGWGSVTDFLSTDEKQYRVKL